MSSRRVRSSRVERSGTKEERRRQRSRRRSRSVTKNVQNAGLSSRTESNRKCSLAGKVKPMAVNELDLVALSQKEQGSRTDIRSNDASQIRSDKMHYRQRSSLIDRRGFWGSRSGGCAMRQGIDNRRTPMYPLRRGVGGSDFDDQRTQYGHNDRRSYQRSTEQKRSKDDSEKPVMNLFDPCKVPTGRSYFTHDDRATKSFRPIRARSSNYGDKSWQSLPVGWRNVRKARRDDADPYDDDSSISNNKRLRKNPVDDVWKHDMFEED